MVLPMSRRVFLLVVLVEFAVVAVVAAIFGNPRSSFAAALAASLALGSLPAGAAAYVLRRRKPPLRFGIPATAIIAIVIWGVFAFGLFIRTYQAY